MDSNTYSTRTAEAPAAPTRVADGPAAPAGVDGLAALVRDVDALAAEDLDGLGDGVVAERALVLDALVNRLAGEWLRTLAVVEGRGAAGADKASWPPPPPAGCGPGCG